MADHSTSLLSGDRPTAPSSPPSTASSTATSSGALYHDSSMSPRAKRIQILFVSLVILMVMISVCLSIYRGIDVDVNGGMYFLLGLSLLGLAAIEIIMILFVRRGQLPKEKAWFLYFVGICVMFEAIFTDVLLFQ